MEFTEIRMEMRGIRRSEIVKYFVGINGEDTGCGKITGQDWDVDIGEEFTVKLGSLTVPASVVVFRCRKDLFEPMITEFRLKFLRMGG